VLRAHADDCFGRPTHHVLEVVDHVGLVDEAAGLRNFGPATPCRAAAIAFPKRAIVAKRLTLVPAIAWKRRESCLSLMARCDANWQVLSPLPTSPLSSDASVGLNRSERPMLASVRVHLAADEAEGSFRPEVDDDSAYWTSRPHCDRTCLNSGQSLAGAARIDPLIRRRRRPIVHAQGR
jgi:hypothetical protein